MAHNLRKFATMADYDNAELVYPAVSWIVSGDTLAYDKTEPQPEPDVLLNAKKIRWNVTDGQERTSVDYPSISFEDAQTLINALNNGAELVATGWYDDGAKSFTGEVTYNLDNSGFPTFGIINPDSDMVYNVCYLSLYNNAKAPAYNAARIVVVKYGGSARWEITYEITPRR